MIVFTSEAPQSNPVQLRNHRAQAKPYTQKARDHNSTNEKRHKHETQS